MILGCLIPTMGNPVGAVDLTNAVIVFDGNSLTYGTGVNPATESYPSQIAAMAPFTTNGADIYNFGVGGQTTPQMSADAATQVDTLYNPAVASIVVASEWLNDVSVNGGSAATLYGNILTYYNARKAEGWRVGICTNHAVNHSPHGSIIAATGDTYLEYYNKVQDINTMILTGGDIDPDDIIRLDTIAELADENDTVYFQSDAVHLTVAGYAHRAEAVYEWLTNLTQ